MTNNKRRRLAKVRVGGDAGRPHPLGNRRARRHGESHPDSPSLQDVTSQELLDLDAEARSGD